MTQRTDPLQRLERRLTEALDALRDELIDPADAYWDDDGVRWLPLGGEAAAAGGVPYATEAELRAIRLQCRALAVGNEFAINGHENRISYIVGPGHRYRVVAAAGRTAPRELIDAVQATVDAFVRDNAWQRRQQEIVRRKDRDGECFLRLFTGDDGATRIRFVEPDQVSTPAERASDPAAGFGVVTERHDVETVRGYFIDGRWVDAADVQHRKANVDENARRGLPLFYPVRKNLRRAEKLLRNMSVVAEIQSAIAIIRKHAHSTRTAVQQFVQGQADASAARPGGTASHFRRYGPGTILDTFAGTDYEFPAAGLDAARYVTVLQAELRAIASRLVMPEFMLTSDASNANYSSTMVAEGPAVRMFERLQHELLREDEELMRRVVTRAVAVGRLPREALTDAAVQGTPPTLAVRDRLRDAQADRILVEAGAMSVHTLALRHGLDPDGEAAAIARHASRNGV